LGPQPPNANAGEIADDSVAETITTPSNFIESFFIVSSTSDERVDFRQWG
jgi:hypothetical protein